VRKNISFFNGKCVYNSFTFDLTAAQIEGIVDERRNKLIKLDGKTPNKVIIVPKITLVDNLSLNI
jgi:hypothetical protein